MNFLTTNDFYNNRYSAKQLIYKPTIPANNFNIKPANIPRNGSVMAVTAMVIPPTAAPPATSAVNAVAALPGTVTIAPSTNKNPAMDSLGIYFLSWAEALKVI